jgi:hypothetical protein
MYSFEDRIYFPEWYNCDKVIEKIWIDKWHLESRLTAKMEPENFQANY